MISAENHLQIQEVQVRRIERRERKKVKNEQNPGPDGIAERTYTLNGAIE